MNHMIFSTTTLKVYLFTGITTVKFSMSEKVSFALPAMIAAMILIREVYAISILSNYMKCTKPAVRI